MMDHPSIAKVFDAGTTPDGQPYFVMEYVRDVPLTDYCNEKKLRIRDRLQLFVQVCEAVQHAHRKTIIHRDLKPGNISSPKWMESRYRGLSISVLRRRHRRRLLRT